MLIRDKNIIFAYKNIIMNIINRPDYTERIERMFNKGVIIALTGQRRVGKSCIMKQVMAHVKEKTENNVIYINKENKGFEHIRDSHDFQEYVDSCLLDDKENYLFVDEIQDIKDFEKTLRSLQSDDACNIMITGSNAKMLSSELATYLSGRHVEYHIQSLSYEEFLMFHNLPDSDESLSAYMQNGGLPHLRRIGLDDTDLVGDYLESIYNTIILKDVIEREEIRNVPLLKTLIRFISDNIGKQFSARSIVKFLKSQMVDSSAKAILTYLEYLCNAYIINKVGRYDIHGRRLFELGDKYYFEDIGLRNQIIAGNRSADIEKVMENIVYLHLRRSGYTVYIGQMHNTEIDFVAQKKDSTIYIQVAYLLASEETVEREFGNLKSINDNHPKYVITLDKFMGAVNRDGIRHLYLRDFLKKKEL